MPVTTPQGYPIEGTLSIRDLVNLANKQKVKSENQAKQLNWINRLNEYTQLGTFIPRLRDDILTNLGKRFIPINAATYLRDLNAASTKHFPSWMHSYVRIRPNILTSDDFTKEELDVIRKASNNGTRHILYGNYPKNVKYSNIWDFLSSPAARVETTLGRASSNNGVVTDIFDFNDGVSRSPTKDFINTSSSIYDNIRGNTRHLNSTNVDNNDYKIKTLIDFNKSKQY